MILNDNQISCYFHACGDCYWCIEHKDEVKEKTKKIMMQLVDWDIKKENVNYGQIHNLLNKGEGI